MLGVACGRYIRGSTSKNCVKIHVPSTLHFLVTLCFIVTKYYMFAQFMSGTLPTSKRYQGSLAFEVSAILCKIP